MCIEKYNKFLLSGTSLFNKKAFLKLIKNGGIHMATITKDYSTSNIFEFSLTKDAIKKVLEMKGISKDYLEQCKKTSQMYKKPSK